MIGFLRSLWCVICANILQFLCRLKVFKLAQDFLLQTFSWCYHKSKTLKTVRIFPLRDLIHLIWLQENKTAVVSNRFIYLVWEFKWLSFYQECDHVFGKGRGDSLLLGNWYTLKLERAYSWQNFIDQPNGVYMKLTLLKLKSHRVDSFRHLL